MIMIRSENFSLGNMGVSENGGWANRPEKSLLELTLAIGDF